MKIDCEMFYDMTGRKGRTLKMKYVAILGFGVVGSGVAEVMQMNSAQLEKRLGEPVQVKRILDIQAFPESPFADIVTSDADLVFNDPDISVVVETIGGTGIAGEFTRRALSAGKSVITSNKELVSRFGVELMTLAKEKKCSYLFEAAVGGGIPIIRPLYRCLSGNQIDKLAGIVNGTTNYILTQMEKTGESYESALKSAQKRGYAEQNPSADIDGLDAQRKLAILSSIALDGMYVDPEKIHTEGISKVDLPDIAYASALQSKVKLLAVFSKEEDRCRCLVAPHLISKTLPLAVADDVFNAILVTGNALGDVMFYGRGAGQMATASAVVGDVVDAILHEKSPAVVAQWHIDDDAEVLLPFEGYPVQVLLRVPDSIPAAEVKSAFPDTSCETVSRIVDGETAYVIGKCGNLTEALLESGKNKLNQVIGCIRMFDLQ